MPESPDERAELDRYVQEQVDAHQLEVNRAQERQLRFRRERLLTNALRGCAAYCHASADGDEEFDLSYGNRYPTHPALEAELAGTGKVTWSFWGKVNRIACKCWAREWQRAAWHVHVNDLEAVVASGEPEHPIQRIAHRLLQRFLGARAPAEFVEQRRHIALDLAREREALARTGKPELRYELASYFGDWLLPRIEKALRLRAERAATLTDLPLYLELAHASLEWASTHWPEDQDDMEMLWHHIEVSGDCPQYQDRPVPRFASWKRYLSEIRKRRDGT